MRNQDRWRNFTYVDNSNLWIEGMRLSAVRAAGSSAAAIPCSFDYSWKIDFGALLALLNGTPGCSYLFGSRTVRNHAVFHHARAAGFVTRVSDRSDHNREVDVDANLIEQMSNDLTQRVRPGDRITLLAGDGGYAPIVQFAQKQGVNVAVWFWTHALSLDLFNAAGQWVKLEDFVEEFRLQQPARRAS